MQRNAFDDRHGEIPICGWLLGLFASVLAEQALNSLIEPVAGLRIDVAVGSLCLIWEAGWDSGRPSSTCREVPYPLEVRLACLRARHPPRPLLHVANWLTPEAADARDEPERRHRTDNVCGRETCRRQRKTHKCRYRFEADEHSCHE